MGRLKLHLCSWLITVVAFKEVCKIISRSVFVFHQNTIIGADLFLKCLCRLIDS